MKQLNNKGALYHWILIALIPAMAVFIYLSVDLPTYGAKGTWAISVERASILAQTDTLAIENQARQVLKTTASDVEDQALMQDYGCGTYRGRSILNNLTGPCQITTTLQTNFQEVASREVTRVADLPFNVTYQDGKIVGIATQTKTIGSFDAIPMRESEASNELVYSIRPFKLEYTYTPSFEITSPVFEKINKYREDAQQIVKLCQNEQSTLTCNLKNLANTYSICKEEIKDAKRVSLVCEKNAQTGLFALDLTPSNPISVAEYKLIPSDTAITINIPVDHLHDSYTIYLTNSNRIQPELINPQDPTELFSSVSENFNEFLLKIPLSLAQANQCTMNKQLNTPYLCGDQLYYILQQDKIQFGETYYVGITSEKNSQESLLGFVTAVQLGESTPVRQDS